MKNRMNHILLAAFLITTALYVLFLLIWMEIIPRPFYNPEDPFRFSALWAFLSLGFHAVPCFFLQILVCRTAKRLVLRLTPVLLLIGIAALFAILFFTSAGWDAMIWAIAFCLCIAPAAGYALAWLMYGILQIFKKRHKVA